MSSVHLSVAVYCFSDLVWESASKSRAAFWMIMVISATHTLNKSQLENRACPDKLKQCITMSDMFDMFYLWLIWHFIFYCMRINKWTGEKGYEGTTPTTMSQDCIVCQRGEIKWQVDPQASYHLEYWFDRL